MADTSKLIVELVKSQIQIERQIKQDIDLEQNLDLLKQKYEWIQQDQTNNAFQPQKIQPKIKIINKSMQQERIKQQQAKLNKQKPTKTEVTKQVKQDKPQQNEQQQQQQQKQQQIQKSQTQMPTQQQKQQPKQQPKEEPKVEEQKQIIQQDQQPLTKNNNQLPPEYDDSPQNLVQCEYCGRKFSADRIEKHHSVCTKNPSHKKIVAKKVKQEFKTGLE